MSGNKSERDAIALSVPTKDGDDEKKDVDSIIVDKENPDLPETSKIGKIANKKGKNAAEELSEEDTLLKEGLELAVTRLREDDVSLHKQALDHLVSEIKSATSSMTSVPKPLKFLRPHYDTLKSVYESWPLLHNMKRLMADVMSVLAMTMADPGSRECLNFKLAGSLVNVSSWGHEYVRSLSGEISEEYNKRALETAAEDDPAVDDLIQLVDDILPFQMKHNAEAEAVDMLLEVRQLNKLVESAVVDERNYERVCLYLIRSADFVADPDDLETLYDTAYIIYKAQNKLTDALRVALKIDNTDYINELFASDTIKASDIQKKQMALILARARSPYALEDGSPDENLNEIIGNCVLSDHFLNVVRALDVKAPKSPEDIYKTKESANNRRGAAGANLDSARANLASTFVNAFVNAGYCEDNLMTAEGEDSGNWLFKNKGHGRMSAAASLGMLMMWNVEEGLNQIDKFFHDGEEFVRAGACLGVGLVSCGVRNESDPALALLTDYLDGSTKASRDVRIAAACGLGIAYAGAQREEVKELLESAIDNTEVGTDMTEVSLAALSVGLCFVGTCDDDIGSVILQRLMESSDTDLAHTSARFLGLALGLLYLGKGERADAVLEAIRTIEHPRGKYCEVTVETCAYAGTGDVLKVQHMLRLCTDHLVTAGAAEHQAVAVLGIALATVGEEIGSEMTLRTFEHLLHYGELPVKRVVPLALSLLYISNPDYGVVDQLSRLSHDQDAELSQCACLGLGLVSAGSNNSRVAGLLRQLAEFYAKKANHLFVVRIAQGLNAMGKGLLSISPFHSDRLLMNGPGLGGILTIMHACIDIKGTILDKMHYLLYFLAPAMNPRVLAFVEPDGVTMVKGSVRVGQAVETVGQAGRPKTITGFQTHSTPVLLGYKDRAELAGRDHVAAASSVMEGTVIVEAAAPEEENVVTESEEFTMVASASS